MVTGRHASREPEVSVVIPVYRSSDTLPRLVTGIRRVMELQSWGHEIILVDDATPDAETQVALELLAQDTDVRVVSLRRNRGQHVATLAGLNLARAQLCIVMDADLQHDPQSIPDLLRPLRESPGLDAVVGAFSVSRHSIFRRFGSRIVGAIIRWSNGMPKGFSFTSFLALRGDVGAAVVAGGAGKLEPVVGLLLAEITDRIVNVEVPHQERVSGSSAWRPVRLIHLTLRLFQSVLFTRRGLRALAGLAVTVGLLAALLAVYYLVRFLVSGLSLTGFTTVVLLVLGSLALSSFLLSALLEGVAGLRETGGNDARSYIRSDSWQPILGNISGTDVRNSEPT